MGNCQTNSDRMDSPSHPFPHLPKSVQVQFLIPLIASSLTVLILEASANRMPSPTSSSPRKPSPEFTQYYGILVKLPRGPNVTAPFAPPFRMRESDRTIPRESKDASAVPSVLSSWDVDSRISFLLVEKTTWDDRDLTLRSKLAAGTYWNMSAQSRGNLRKEMDRTEVAQISGIEVIGLGDGEYDALKKCRQCKYSSPRLKQHISIDNG